MQMTGTVLSHLSERALANDLDRPKVRQAYLGSPKPEMLRLELTILAYLTFLGLVGDGSLADLLLELDATEE